MMLLNEKVDTGSTTLYPAVIQNLYYDIRSVLLHLDISTWYNSAKESANKKAAINRKKVGTQKKGRYIYGNNK